MQVVFDHVTIANAALTLIRAQPVKSFDDADRRSQAVSALYWTVLDRLLTVTRWHFASGYSRLTITTVDTTVDRRGWLHSHALPSDRIGPPVMACEDPAKPERLTAFELTETHFLSDKETVYVRMTRRVGPVNWPGYFRNLMVRALASDLAEPIRGDAALAQRFYRECFGTPQEGGQGGLFKEARDQDHAARPPEVFGAGDAFLGDRERLNEYTYRF